MMKLMVGYFVKNIHKVMNAHILVVCFGLEEINVMVTLKMILWIFIYNLINVCSTSMQENYVLEEEVKIFNFFHRGLHGKRLVNIASLGY